MSICKDLKTCAVKKQPEAIIPDREMKKLKNSISQTQCALPDADEFTKELADQVYKIITLKHEHTHRHYSYSASFDMINDTAKKWIIGLAISTLMLTATLITGIVHLMNSEMYLGKKYMELYQSDLLTKSEKEKLLKDAYMVSLYPEAYEGYPKAFRERLRKNKSIVDDRELEKIVKGKFSVKEKVGF